MKSMTCNDMGGPCDATMTAGSAEEMMKHGMDHVDATHPEVAETIKAMTPEEQETWKADFMKKWDATPAVAEDDEVAAEAEEEDEEEAEEGTEEESSE